jgi:3D (Asp-Asp-Asp) domain-containing protein
LEQVNSQAAQLDKLAAKMEEEEIQEEKEKEEAKQRAQQEEANAQEEEAGENQSKEENQESWETVTEDNQEKESAQEDTREETKQEESESTESETTGEATLLGTFKLTAYCSCAKCCGTANNTTASGTWPTAGRTVAMAGLPFGTKLLINGSVYIVEDLGTPYGHVDIYMNSHSEALGFGLQYAQVYRLN